MELLVVENGDKDDDKRERSEGDSLGLVESEIMEKWGGN